MTYQNVQENMIYIYYQNHALLSKLNLVQIRRTNRTPLIRLGFVRVQTLEHLNPSQFDLHILGFILCILNLSYHHA
jgi:hypothetical protein